MRIREQRPKSRKRCDRHAAPAVDIDLEFYRDDIEDLIRAAQKAIEGMPNYTRADAEEDAQANAEEDDL
jgi:hypothetical protein